MAEPKKLISPSWCSHTSGVQLENAREAWPFVSWCLELTSYGVEDMIGAMAVKGKLQIVLVG